jgi:hypothetical protein
LLIYGILRQPKVTISFSSSSRGREVVVSSRGREAGRLFKRKGDDRKRVVSSRGREAGRPYRIAKMYL